MALLIDGKKIARGIRDEVRDEIKQLQNTGKQVPGLAVVLVGDDPASAVYVNSKAKICKKLGMHSQTEIFPATTSEAELLECMDTLNRNPSIHGILVQFPLPDHINADRIVEAITPEKDVDGLHPFNIGLLAAGRPRFIPCTPYGILELLKRSSISPEGREVVILGRSNLVGRPLANLLSSKTENGNATVTLCHSRSRNLHEICRRADILIVAIGRKRFVTADMVKRGAVVIDVGIHRLQEEEGGGLCGDVDFAAVQETASAITPVPGGVGPMTIAMLMRNTTQAYYLATSSG